MLGMVRKGNEAVFPVERRRTRILGVNDDGIAGDALAGFDDSVQHVDQEQAAEALSPAIEGGSGSLEMRLRAPERGSHSTLPCDTVVS